jgi:hypothetical protein
MIISTKMDAILAALEAVVPFILVATLCYISYLYYRTIKRPSLDTERQNGNITIYVRMIWYAIAGFMIFFGGTWFGLKQVGTNKWLWNPYASSPPIITCLFIGCFGITIGALVGLITAGKQRPRKQ